MTLWACRGCPAKYSVGAPACPHCGSTDHYEEGSVMPKITVHGGPSNAGARVVGGGWSDTTTPDEWPTVSEQEPVAAPDVSAVSVSVDGVDQGPGEVLEFDGEPEFEPLPEAVEDTPAKQEPAPDYESWTVARLREVLAARELPTSGTKAELVTRLRTHDEP